MDNRILSYRLVILLVFLDTRILHFNFIPIMEVKNQNHTLIKENIRMYKNNLYKNVGIYDFWY